MGAVLLLVCSNWAAMGDLISAPETVAKKSEANRIEIPQPADIRPQKRVKAARAHCYRINFQLSCDFDPTSSTYFDMGQCRQLFIARSCFNFVLYKLLFLPTTAPSFAPFSLSACGHATNYHLAWLLSQKPPPNAKAYFIIAPELGLRKAKSPEPDAHTYQAKLIIVIAGAEFDSVLRAACK